MEHFVFLFSLISLIIGLGVVAGLYRGWRSDRRAQTFWQLVHFAGFTFTMVVSVVDAYALINLGLGVDFTRSWTALVLVGCGVMTFAFPHLARATYDRPATVPFSWVWGALATIPLAGAAGIQFTAGVPWILVTLVPAFVPFFAAIVYGLALGRGREKSWEGWGVFAVLVLVASVEVWWILGHPEPKGYFFLTLPLAYLYSALATWRDRPPPSVAGDRPPPNSLELAEDWAKTQGLTAREREVARGILRALSNKELAFELGLSENTVRNHIASLYRKLGIQKRLDLVVLVQTYQRK